LPIPAIKRRLLTTEALQYELDGASETHDPSLPTTNACPYLPGQTVNTLWVPVEQPSRKRSASLNSLRDEDYKTMNPADKFATPRPAPVPSESSTTFRRIGSAPRLLSHKRSARSLSPGSGWSFSPRKLFSRKPSSSSLVTDDLQSWDDRSIRSEGSRSRDISPESLRRFLVQDPLPMDEPEPVDRPAIAIPEDIVEEIEDDDNFATSAVSETQAFTGLSPPPTQRSNTSSPTPPAVIAIDEDANAPWASEPEQSAPAPPTRPPPMVPQLDLVPEPVPHSRFSFSDASFCSQLSPQSPDSNSPPSFYHSEDEDDEITSSNEEESVALPGILSTMGARSSFVRDLDAALSTYSLPPPPTHETEKLRVVTETASGDAALLASDGVVGGNTSLLTSPIPNSGLEDLVTELGWMADVIRGKDA